MPSVFGGAAMPLLSAIALLAGTIFLILGFAAPYWAFDGSRNIGLWRFSQCDNPEHHDCWRWDQVPLKDIPVWLHVARAFECCALIFVSIPLVILPFYMYIALGMYYRRMMATMSCFSLLSTICGIVGVVIYGVNLTDNDWDLGWALIMVIIGCGLIFIGFLVLFVATVLKRPPSVKRDYYPTTLFVDPDKNKLYAVRVDE